MRMLLIACAALSLTATDAGAAAYVATPPGEGRMLLDLDDGRLRRVRALPARCESNSGRRRDSRLAVDLTGDRAFKEGRFGSHGRATSRVRYDVGGGRRGRATVGRARLTSLDLDFVAPSDDSLLCDTGTRRCRAVR